ncbi:MAG: aldolase/citrate lyase family protein [Isosphaeraceae bacterium]|nr:aldolase/citrate lyase family protein [Isosphaeraceae bacterium]
MFESINHLKSKLARGETTLGIWVTLEAPTITEIAALLGFDWVVIDTEHGHLDFKEVVEHIRALRGSTTTPLVRVPEVSRAAIKRVLDLGAHGVIVPQVETAAEVERAAQFVKYPPRGLRGIGGERATHWGMGLREQTRLADAQTQLIPLIENVHAADALEGILDVPGVDALFFGPADFSASAGYLGEWEGPGVAERILALKDAARARGVPCGVMATDLENALLRQRQGFQMIGIGSDTGLLIRSAREALARLRDAAHES